MTDVYVDSRLALGPGAALQLGHLVDAGQSPFLVGAWPGDRATLPDVPRLEEIPPDPARGSWFVTADPARCGQRIAGLRTLLIGPRVGRSPTPGPRCDAEARDLAAAVLTILAHDAMGT
jgi:hypothetical protein